MVNLERFYTYAYLRENGTPYYIGKGSSDRIYRKRTKGVNAPKDKSRIIFLKQNLTEEDAFKHEIYMISVLGRKDLRTGILHNRTNGGEGISGYAHNEETKKKISEIGKGRECKQETRKKLSEVSKGKTLSEETKRKLSEARKGEKNPNYGKKMSEETKRKISEANTGNSSCAWNKGKQIKSFSEEHKKKMSEYAKNRSEEHKEKLKESAKGRIPPTKGKKMSEDHKRKIGEANRKRWEERKNKLSVLQ
jgi:hypothetical protein